MVVEVFDAVGAVNAIALNEKIIPRPTRPDWKTRHFVFNFFMIPQTENDSVDSKQR